MKEKKVMALKLLGRIIFILSILLNTVLNIDAQEEAPPSIELAAQITLETLNSPELQKVDIENKISFIESLVRTSLTTPNNLIFVEKAPISVVIGMFYSDENYRHFMYFYTKGREKYHKQPFSFGWPMGTVIATKCRKYEGRFLMELLLSVGADVDNWAMVDMYTLRWDGHNWQKVWRLDIDYKEVLKSLNISNRFGIPEPDCYKQYADFVDLDRDGIDEIVVTCYLLGGDFLPSTNLADTIDLELFFVREGDKYNFNSARIEQTPRNTLREFIWLLRCGAGTEVEKLVLNPSIIDTAEKWGLGSLKLHWQFIDSPEQVPDSERNVASNIVGKKDNLLFWNGNPPFFIARFGEANGEYKLADIQRLDNLVTFQKDGEVGSYSISMYSILPKIDGIIDAEKEWKNIEYYQAGFIPFNPRNWKGAKDLSARVRGAWSNDRLYFAVEVTDDILLQEWQKLSLWRGDHLELWFDTDLKGDAGTTKVDGDDFQIGISPGNFGAIKPEVYCWLPKKKIGRMTQAEVAAKRTKDGYIIEASIPFKFLQIKPEDGKVVGFTLLISDTDSKSTPQKCMISIFPDFKYANPTTWGTLGLTIDN